MTGQVLDGSQGHEQRVKYPVSEYERNMSEDARQNERDSSHTAVKVIQSSTVINPSHSVINCHRVTVIICHNTNSESPEASVREQRQSDARRSDAVAMS